MFNLMILWIFLSILLRYENCNFIHDFSSLFCFVYLIQQFQDILCCFCWCIFCWSFQTYIIKSLKQFFNSIFLSMILTSFSIKIDSKLPIKLKLFLGFSIFSVSSGVWICKSFELMHHSNESFSHFVLLVLI